MRAGEGEGGQGGFGWDPPSSEGPAMVPAEDGLKIFNLKSSWRRSKTLAVSLKHWKGRRGAETELGDWIEICKTDRQTVQAKTANEVMHSSVRHKCIFILYAVLGEDGGGGEPPLLLRGRPL